jgi:uncharacterized protein (TIGR02118 family)
VTKRLVFIKRRPELDVADFRSELTDKLHSRLAALSGIRRCVLHLTHESGYRRHDPDYDAVVEMAFEDVAAAATFDDGAFAGHTMSGSVLAHEVVIVDGDAKPDALTMFAFLNRLPDTDPAAFSAYWRDHHGPIAAQVPGIRRYVQNHVLQSGPQPPYDGIAQTWFDDLDAVRASASSSELQRTRDDEPNFMVSGRLPFAVCTQVSLVV